MLFAGTARQRDCKIVNETHGRAFDNFIGDAGKTRAGAEFCQSPGNAVANGHARNRNFPISDILLYSRPTNFAIAKFNSL
jgi:hypothetical protein